MRLVSELRALGLGRVEECPSCQLPVCIACPRPTSGFSCDATRADEWTARAPVYILDPLASAEAILEPMTAAIVYL